MKTENAHGLFHRSLYVDRALGRPGRGSTCGTATAAAPGLSPGSCCTTPTPGRRASIRLTEHLELEGVAPSIGSAGDVYDNALMESIVDLFNTECIATTVFRESLYNPIADVEYAPGGWADLSQPPTPAQIARDARADRARAGHYAALSREPHPV